MYHFGVNKVIPLQASPLNQSMWGLREIVMERERECKRNAFTRYERVNALTNRPKCIVHTYIMNGKHKGIGRCSCKWLNFDLLKLKDYSDWKRFMGFNHYIYKSSFSPAAAASTVQLLNSRFECIVLYTLLYWRLFFYPLLIPWTSVFPYYVGNTSCSLLSERFSLRFRGARRDGAILFLFSFDKKEKYIQSTTRKKVTSIPEFACEEKNKTNLKYINQD